MVSGEAPRQLWASLTTLPRHPARSRPLSRHQLLEGQSVPHLTSATRALTLLCCAEEGKCTVLAKQPATRRSWAFTCTPPRTWPLDASLRGLVARGGVLGSPGDLGCPSGLSIRSPRRFPSLVADVIGQHAQWLGGPLVISAAGMST